MEVAQESLDSAWLPKTPPPENKQQPTDVPFHFIDVCFTRKKVPQPAPYILR